MGWFLFFACAGTRPKADWGASDFYKEAKLEYDDEDYFDAANSFTVTLIRFAGSGVADSAQYYLAMSHFMMGDYLIATAEFNRLINDMNQSPLVPKSQYMLGESYYQMSPRAALDQENTLKAIREFQYFVEENPTDSLKEDAEKKIYELREKLAEKEWNNAEIYRKMSEYQAALIYFDQVLTKYYDTAWADDALLGKINTLIESDDYEQALLEVVKFEQQFPDSQLNSTVSELKESLTKKQHELAKE
jgi:outer membrane protein assembly factor BamD